MPRHIASTYRLSTNTSYIILAAGSGRRKNQPCGLFNGGLLVEQCNTIRKFDSIGDIITVVGFKAQSIINQKPACRIVENVLFESTNACESLRLGLNNTFPSNLYIVHGDIEFNMYSFTVHDQNAISIPISNINDTKKPGITQENNRLQNLSYGLVPTWGQMLYIPYHYYYQFKDFIAKSNKNHSLMELINNLNVSIPILTHKPNKALFREHSW